MALFILRARFKTPVARPSCVTVRSEIACLNSPNNLLASRCLIRSEPFAIFLQDNWGNQIE